MGKFLGLKEETSQKIEMGGIGGKIGVYLVSLRIRIGNYPLEAKVAWAQIEEVPFLLGREGIFDRFDIIFEQRNHKTIFIWQGENKICREDPQGEFISFER